MTTSALPSGAEPAEAVRSMPTITPTGNPSGRESMTTYQVGYFVGSLSSTSINRDPVQGADPPGARRPGVHRDPDREPAAVQPGLRRELPTRGQRAEGGDRSVRRHPVRHPGVQPVHSRSAEERDRLGVAAVGPELLRPHPGGGDRGVHRADRHRGGPAEPARRAQLLQRPADDRAGGLHPVLSGGLPRRRRGRRRVHQDLPRPTTWRSSGLTSFGS